MNKSGYIITILVFVILELFTLAHYNIERENLLATLEKKTEEISELKEELKKFSDSPKTMLEYARKAFYSNNGDEVARIYRQFRKYHNLAPEMEQMKGMVKTLNARINNKALSEVRSEIATEEHEENTQFVPMPKEQAEELERIFSAALQANQLKDKYGEQAIKTAMQRKVKIGWTKELCEAALGKPKKIITNTSANEVFETWLYENTCLNFSNGKLESIYSEK